MTRTCRCVAREERSRCANSDDKSALHRFHTITRSHTADASRDGSELAARAVRLLDKTDAGKRAVRLLGVSVHNLCTSIEDRTKSNRQLPFVE